MLAGYNAVPLDMGDPNTQEGRERVPERYARYAYGQPDGHEEFTLISFVETNSQWITEIE